MNYYPNRYHPYWNTARAVGIFILSVMFMFKSWRSYSNSRIIENDGTWKPNDLTNCIEFNYNPSPHRLEVECSKRYGSGEYFYLLLAIFFFALAVLQVVYIFKRFFASVQESQQGSAIRQESSVEHPFIGTGSVSCNYSVNNATNINPVAPPFHLIMLAPTSSTPAAVSKADEPPPEYLPPPTYNECEYIRVCDK